MSVYFHQFWPVMAVPRENQHEQQNILVAICSELWCIHCPLATDDMYSACVRRCMDGSLRQVYVHRCRHNRSVIHPDMVASMDSWCEEDYLNKYYGDKRYI